MIPVFKRSAYGFALQYQGDGEFGVNDIKPLYQDLKLDDNNGKEPLRICDQKHVFINLVKRASASNKNLAYCAVIHSIADAVDGRAGEALPQTYGDWSHDYKWNATNSWWKEKKTIQKYAMPRVADEHWYMDWYMFMAMYCLIDNGLYRTPKQIDDGQLLTVFPFLHGKSDSYCAEKITNVIRSALPEAVREQFSSKSLRQAGISNNNNLIK
jgi:hypothetical protein